MKKMIVLMLFIIPLSATADNIIFNPGFDMTPWDTGWVKDTSTDTSFAGSGYAEATAIIDSSSLAVSPTRSCNLKTIISCYNVAGVPGAATADARATITQAFNPVSNCLFKVSEIDSYYGVGKYQYYSTQLCINGEWKVFFGGGVYKNWTEICTTITEPDTVTGVRFISSEGGGGGGTAGWMVYRYNSRYIDNVQIVETSIEEETRNRKQGSKIETYPNPFVSVTTVRFENERCKINKLQIYDISGKLIEEVRNDVIGKDLKAGVYFVKVNDNKLVKMIKIRGGIK